MKHLKSYISLKGKDKNLDFIIDEAAYKSAKVLIEKEERILASEKDKETFFSALFDHETKPNNALHFKNIEIIKRHKL